MKWAEHLVKYCKYWRNRCKEKFDFELCVILRTRMCVPAHKCLARFESLFRRDRVPLEGLFNSHIRVTRANRESRKLKRMPGTDEIHGYTNARERDAKTQQNTQDARSAWGRSRDEYNGYLYYRGPPRDSARDSGEANDDDDDIAKVVSGPNWFHRLPPVRPVPAFVAT